VHEVAIDPAGAPGTQASEQPDHRARRDTHPAGPAQVAQHVVVIASAAARGVDASPAVVAGYVLVAHAVLVLGSVVLAAPLLAPTLLAAGRGRRVGARGSGGAPPAESPGRAGALRRPCG
jgi:hypothetical protein